MEIFIGFIPYAQYVLNQPNENQDEKLPKGYVCNTCNESFATSRGLEIHANKMHNKYPKTSVCTQCLKSFKNKYLLATHKKQVHRRLQRVECVKCTKFFSSKFTLQKHLKTKHQAIVNIN